MDLTKELNSFMEFLRTHALPGFRQYTEDTYSESYDTLSSELEYIGNEIRKAVRRNDEDHFLIMRDAYEKQFMAANAEMARAQYADKVDQYLDEGFENLDAEVSAAHDLWGDYKTRFWLPASIRMVGPGGEEIYLVGHERHAPKDKPYVLPKEIKKIKDENLNPWKFIQTRGTHENRALSS